MISFLFRNRKLFQKVFHTKKSVVRVYDKDIGQSHMTTRKPYLPPSIKKYSSISDLPQHVREGVADITECAAALRVVVDDQRRYQSVDLEAFGHTNAAVFANLLGYDPDELQGKRIDDVTARGTIDIEFAFNAFLKLGEMDGLWMFERRDGKKVLFHYHACRMEDRLSYADFEPLPLAG